MEGASGYCPWYGPFFGFAGITFAMVFSAVGACYGTARSGVGIAGMGVSKPDLVMKSLIPVIMAGILGIYGLVVAVMIAAELDPARPYSFYQASMHLGAGLCVGLTSMAAGYAIGTVGDVGVKAYATEQRLFVAMVLILIFAEVLGLYGLITAILLITNAGTASAPC